MEVTSNNKQISEYTKIVKAFLKDKKLFSQEKDMLELMKLRYEMFYSQIHNYLAPQKTDSAELEIQEHIKTICAYDYPICERKIELFKQASTKFNKVQDIEKERLCYKYMQEWLTLADGFYRLLAFRSLEHFANYMEMDRNDKDKIWKYSLDPYNDGGYTGPNKPFFYFFNQMVLKKDIKFISKQQPTGFGKTISNNYAIAWLFGVDINTDILIVLGNPSLISMNMNNIVNLIKNPKFVKIFPQFEKYLSSTEDKNGNTVEVVSDSIFDTCRIKDGELTFADSEKPINLKVISKDTSVDGVRVRYLFLDDICRSADAGNMKQHKKDIDNFWNSWWKRNYNTEDFYVIVGGTAYSIFDIISELISYYSKGKMQTIKEFKYAYKSMDEKCVFIKVPKIDEDLERSTYPQKFPYAEALAIKDRDYRSFMAMEQQRPLPPDNSPFYIENLQTYEAIPEEGRSDCCWAALDSARIGYDYNSMPIFALVDDKFYLKDCLYQNVPMEKMYQQIVDKIKQHKITKFVIEKNIDTSLKKLLEKMLQEQGVYYCDIIEVYSTENKLIKITNMENTIKNCIVFPAMGLYSYSSQMGKFLNDVYLFSYIHKNEHDDSIDSLATFCKKLVVGGQKTSKAKIISV